MDWSIVANKLLVKSMNVQNKAYGLIVVLFAYVLIWVVSLLVYATFSFESILFKLLWINVVSTLIIFFLNYLFRSYTFYVPYWALVPLFIVFYFMATSPNGDPIRQWTILFLTLIWSVLMISNWAFKWQGFKYKDWRYQYYKEEKGLKFWGLYFLRFHLLPSILVFLLCLPMLKSIPSSFIFNGLDVLATFLTLIAIFLKWQANIQLISFNQTSLPHEFMDKGFWTYVRYPKYQSEILFWLGMFIFGIATERFFALWTGIGTVAIILYFKYLDIPMLDKRMYNKLPAYKKYMKTVPPLFPKLNLEIKRVGTKKLESNE